MSEVDWTKLTIPLAELDVARILGFWQWMVDRPVWPLDVTRFGDWFVSDHDGAVLRLSILEGTLLPVCGSLAEYRARRAGDHELADWFQDGMVHELHEGGLVPGTGQGFGYRMPPILGGSLDRDNIIVVNMPSWQLFMAQLHDKLRSVPPSARITRLDTSETGELHITFVDDEEEK